MWANPPASVYALSVTLNVYMLAQITLLAMWELSLLYDTTVGAVDKPTAAHEHTRALENKKAGKATRDTFFFILFYFFDKTFTIAVVRVVFYLLSCSLCL